MKKFSNLICLLIYLLVFTQPSQALFGSNKTEYEKGLELQKKAEEKRLKKLEKERKKREKEERKRLEKLEKERQKALKDKEKHELKVSLTSEGKKEVEEEKEVLVDEQIIRLEEDTQESKKQRSKSGKGSSKNKKDQELEALRQQLKENEKKALEFVFPSIENDEELNSENFFTHGEKEQLLELWRATLARNRTIQFIIKSLSSNPNEYEKNNAVMQVLSKALFIPFYAIQSVADNALVSGGSAVGARVIGDVVDSGNKKKNVARQITRTDMIVLFMLVDEVAQRMRTAYYSYKTARIDRELLKYELETARLDLDQAIKKTSNTSASTFLNKTVIKDLERRHRKNKLDYLTNRRTLVELAGLEAVEAVDLLIDLEVQEISADILGV